MNIDVTFLTIAQDSSRSIRQCVDSCAGLGSHLVVDGGSTDDTVALAEEAGAKTLLHEFKYAAAQYNYGLNQVETEWCFIIDSDETLSPELRTELQQIVPSTGLSAYEVPRLNLFLGSEIRHSGWWPDHNARLVRVAHCRYDDREVHARIIAEGKVARTTGHLIHETYVSLEQYIAKLNDFTSLEVPSRTKKQTVSDRRSRVRSLWLHTPFRPLTKFLYMYIVRRGYRDGRPGFELAVLSAFYEYVTGLKVKYSSEPSRNRRM